MGQRHRHVQQRARGRDPQAIAQARLQRLQPRQDAAQVAAPDVAPIDHAHRQHRLRRQRGQPRVELLRRPHQVDVEALHRQLCGQHGVVGRGVEIGGQQQLQAGRGQLVVRGLEGGQPVGRQVQAKHGLIHLHPLHTALLEAREEAAVGLHQAGQQAEAVKTRAGGGLGAMHLGQPQEADGPQDDGLGHKALGQRLIDLVEQPVHAAVKGGVRAQLGHEVVVVGVEPLGHLHGGLVGATTGQFEVLRQRQALGVETEACGQGAQCGRERERGVVPGEVAHGHLGQARLTLQGPVALAQGAAGVAQLRLAAVAAPEAFQGELQLAVRAHARESQGVCVCHVLPSVPCSACVQAPRQAGRWQAVWPAAPHESSEMFSHRLEFNSCR